MRVFRFALPCLFVAGLALFFARAWAERADQASRSLQLEHARRQFVERAAVVRASPDTGQYRGELRALLRDWFAGQMELGNRYPAQRGQPGAFVPPAPRAHGDGLHEWGELADAQVGPPSGPRAPSSALRAGAARVHGRARCTRWSGSAAAAAQNESVRSVGPAESAKALRS